MTTPAPLVTPADVCRTQGRAVTTDPTELAQLQELCVQAQAEIRYRVVAVDARIEAGSLDPVRVRGVAVDMVLAALENLELGFRSTGETYPEAGTTNVAAANRLTVEMTDSQIAALAPPPLPGGGMYAVSLSG